MSRFEVSFLRTGRVQTSRTPGFKSIGGISRQAKSRGPAEFPGLVSGCDQAFWAQVNMLQSFLVKMCRVTLAWQSRIMSTHLHNLPGGAFHDALQTYAVEREGNVFRWYMDNVDYFTLTRSTVETHAQWMFAAPGQAARMALQSSPADEGELRPRVSIS